MTIQWVCEQTGFDRATVRFYEQEGLLHPARQPNGYRTYTDADVTQLLRIRLLRQLGASIAEISALQKGERTLSQTLEQCAQRLAQTQREAVRARQLCREIGKTCTRYDALEPRQYLDDASSAPHDAPKVQPHPWRRYLARMLDISLCNLCVTAVLVFACNVNPATRPPILLLLDGFVALLLLVALEPLLIHWWGTTIGKALLGLHVQTMDGEKLSYMQSLSRTMDVLWFGMGMGIPIYAQIRLYKSWKTCKEAELLAWDEMTPCEAMPLRKRHAAAYSGAVALVLGLSVLIALAAGMPPHRGRLTPAQFADNYNHLAAFFKEDAAVLNENGEWFWTDSQITDGIYLSGWGEKAPVVWINTDQDGYVTDVATLWCYDDEDEIAPWPLLRMQLLSMAFGVQEENWLFCRVKLPRVLSQAKAFSDFSLTAGNVQMNCIVRVDGFDAGNSFAISQDTDASCCIVFGVACKEDAS
jgi:DNA-binding transcriptional MerR regulator